MNVGEMLLQKVLSIIPFVITISGILGNISNIIVFGKRKMRASSTFRFLLYLSITDLLVLLIVVTEMLFENNFMSEPTGFSLFSCNLQKFFKYTASYTSSCISIAVNVDRAVIVSNLSMCHIEKIKHKDAQFLKQNGVQLKARVKSNIINSFRNLNTHLVDIIVMGIVLAMLVLNIHYIILMKSVTLFSFTHNNDMKDTYSSSNFNFNVTEIFTCTPKKNSLYEHFLVNVWFWIDISLYSILPCVIMAVCSLIIIVKLQKINRNYLNFLSKKTDPFNKSIYMKKSKKNFQICLMLVSTNLYFLLTMVIYGIWFAIVLKDETGSRILWRSYVIVLLYTNNAFGFLFYGISSEKYRQVFYATFFKVSRLRLT